MEHICQSYLRKINTMNYRDRCAVWFILMILLQWWNDILREANVFNTSQMGKNYQYHINITKHFNNLFRAFVIDDILKSGLFKKREVSLFCWRILYFFKFLGWNCFSEMYVIKLSWKNCHITVTLLIFCACFWLRQCESVKSGLIFILSFFFPFIIHS